MSSTTWRDPAQMGAALDEAFDPRGHVPEAAAAFAALAPAGNPPGRLLVLASSPPAVTAGLLVWGPLWWLARHPTARITVVLYSRPAAAATGRRIRDRVRSHGQALNLRLAPHTVEPQAWEVRAGGGVTACAPGPRPPLQPQADLLIIEDPHRLAVEISHPETRAQTVEACRHMLDWHLKAGAPAMVLMRPNRSDDLAGTLQREEAGRWRVLDGSPARPQAQM